MNAWLESPSSVFGDASGNIYVVVGSNIETCSVRKIDATSGIITTVAGGGPSGFSGDGEPAVEASFSGPPIGRIYVDPSGNIYIADSGNHRIRKVDAATGIITTFAGNGQREEPTDGIPAIYSGLIWPMGVWGIESGDVYIMDETRVLHISGATGLMTVVAGGGGDPWREAVPALEAGFHEGREVAVDGAGNIYVLEFYNGRIRKVDASTGLLTTVMGRTKRNTVSSLSTDVVGYGEGGNYSGDGIPATVSTLARPSGIAIDGLGNLYIADRDNNRIRKVTGETGIISTVAGTGEAGFSGDGDLAIQSTVFLAVA